MGETGVGKTSLVDYLSKVIDADCMTMNIHAGITDDEIAKFMGEAQTRAKNFYNNKKIDQATQQMIVKKVIIFFDEINTNQNISGLLKEIFIDRCVLGEPLMENIALISACNPYKLRDKELSQQTSGLQYKARDETMSRLVYRVNPLPESMISFIWDYKSLNLDEEKKYIEKMIQQKYENSTITGKSFSLVKLWVKKD
jgi:E3 ubiquitin-protein ligase RNF213